MQNILYNPKQFQFHSQFQPSSDSNILHTDNYMSRTRPPQNILHTQLTIPKIFQFLASNHFLTRYLHLHITRLVHTFPQASIFCLLSRRPTTENYAFSSPPSTLLKLKLIPPYHGAQLYIPRRLSFPGNRDIRHDDPPRGRPSIVHETWKSWGGRGFQVGATSFREFTDTRERVGKIMLRNTRPTATPTGQLWR